MKREFLQGLSVGDMPLTKEVIDAIMAENGRDIQNVKAHYSDYEALKEQLAQAEGAQEALQAAKDWEEKYNRQLDTHRREMSDLIFDHMLEKAILSAKGRNAKAITALLDVDTLKASENQTAALEEALQLLKKDCGYLFQAETPPPYARGTGAATPEENRSPATLAGALLEKFERK
ncbi:MAG: phage scaffolding protein [Oscillospiraceae bacterium]|nr:phage scaffolding protein [Oscillospiraceae bacterium]